MSKKAYGVERMAYGVRRAVCLTLSLVLSFSSCPSYVFTRSPAYTLTHSRLSTLAPSTSLVHRPSSLVPTAATQPTYLGNIWMEDVAQAVSQPYWIRSQSGNRRIGLGTQLSPVDRYIFTKMAEDYMTDIFNQWRDYKKDWTVFSMVVGHDGRPAGDEVVLAQKIGFYAAMKRENELRSQRGVPLITELKIFDLGVVTTPILCESIQILSPFFERTPVGEWGAQGGAMVTASHNPLDDDGVKYLTGGLSYLDGSGHGPESRVFRGGVIVQPADIRRMQQRFNQDIGIGVEPSQLDQTRSKFVERVALYERVHRELPDDVKSPKQAQRDRNLMIALGLEEVSAYKGALPAYVSGLRAQLLSKPVTPREWVRDFSNIRIVLDGAGLSADRHIADRTVMEHVLHNLGFTNTSVVDYSKRHRRPIEPVNEGVRNAVEMLAEARGDIALIPDGDADRGNTAFRNPRTGEVVVPEAWDVATLNILLVILDQIATGKLYFNPHLKKYVSWGFRDAQSLPEGAAFEVVLHGAAPSQTVKMVELFGGEVVWAETGENNIVGTMRELDGYRVVVAGAEVANGGTVYRGQNSRDGLATVILNAKALAYGYLEDFRQAMRNLSGEEPQWMDERDQPVTLDNWFLPDLLRFLPERIQHRFIYNPAVATVLPHPVDHRILKNRLGEAVRQYFGQHNWLLGNTRVNAGSARVHYIHERVDFGTVEQIPPEHTIGTVHHAYLESTRNLQTTGSYTFSVDGSGDWRFEFEDTQGRSFFLWVRGSKTEPKIRYGIDVPAGMETEPAVRQLYDWLGQTILEIGSALPSTATASSSLPQWRAPDEWTDEAIIRMVGQGLWRTFDSLQRDQLRACCRALQVSPARVEQWRQERVGLPPSAGLLPVAADAIEHIPVVDLTAVSVTGMSEEQRGVARQAAADTDIVLAAAGFATRFRKSMVNLWAMHTPDPDLNQNRPPFSDVSQTKEFLSRLLAFHAPQENRTPQRLAILVDRDRGPPQMNKLLDRYPDMAHKVWVLLPQQGVRTGVQILNDLSTTMARFNVHLNPILVVSRGAEKKIAQTALGTSSVRWSDQQQVPVLNSDGSLAIRSSATGLEIYQKPNGTFGILQASVPARSDDARQAMILYADNAPPTHPKGLIVPSILALAHQQQADLVFTVTAGKGPADPAGKIAWVQDPQSSRRFLDIIERNDPRAAAIRTQELTSGRHALVNVGSPTLVSRKLMDDAIAAFERGEFPAHMKDGAVEFFLTDLVHWASRQGHKVVFAQIDSAFHGPNKDVYGLVAATQRRHELDHPHNIWRDDVVDRLTYLAQQGHGWVPNLLKPVDRFLIEAADLDANAPGVNLNHDQVSTLLIRFRESKSAGLVTVSDYPSWTSLPADQWTHMWGARFFGTHWDSLTNPQQNELLMQLRQLTAPEPYKLLDNFFAWDFGQLTTAQKDALVLHYLDFGISREKADYYFGSAQFGWSQVPAGEKDLMLARLNALRFTPRIADQLRKRVVGAIERPVTPAQIADGDAAFNNIPTDDFSWISAHGLSPDQWSHAAEGMRNTRVAILGGGGSERFSDSLRNLPQRLDPLSEADRSIFLQILTQSLSLHTGERWTPEQVAQHLALDRWPQFIADPKSPFSKADDFWVNVLAILPDLSGPGTVELDWRRLRGQSALFILLDSLATQFALADLPLQPDLIIPNGINGVTIEARLGQMATQELKTLKPGPKDMSGTSVDPMWENSRGLRHVHRLHQGRHPKFDADGNCRVVLTGNSAKLDSVASGTLGALAVSSVNRQDATNGPKAGIALVHADNPVGLDPRVGLLPDIMRLVAEQEPDLLFTVTKSDDPTAGLLVRRTDGSCAFLERQDPGRETIQNRLQIYITQGNEPLVNTGIITYVSNRLIQAAHEAHARGEFPVRLVRSGDGQVVIPEQIIPDLLTLANHLNHANRENYKIIFVRVDSRLFQPIKTIEQLAQAARELAGLKLRTKAWLNRALSAKRWDVPNSVQVRFAPGTEQNFGQNVVVIRRHAGDFHRDLDLASTLALNRQRKEREDIKPAILYIPPGVNIPDDAVIYLDNRVSAFSTQTKASTVQFDGEIQRPVVSADPFVGIRLVRMPEHLTEQVPAERLSRLTFARSPGGSFTAPHPFWGAAEIYFESVTDSAL